MNAGTISLTLILLWPCFGLTYLLCGPKKIQSLVISQSPGRLVGSVLVWPLLVMNNALDRQKDEQEEIPFKPPEAIPAAITDPFELWIVDSKTTLEYGVWLLKQAEAREKSLAETIKQGVWTCNGCGLQFAQRPASHDCSRQGTVGKRCLVCKKDVAFYALETHVNDKGEAICSWCWNHDGVRFDTESHRAWMTDIDFASRRDYCHRCGYVNFSVLIKESQHYVPLDESVNEILTQKDRLVTCADCKLKIPDTKCFYYADTRKYHCKPATCQRMKPYP